jgi:hypothetical protein
VDVETAAVIVTRRVWVVTDRTYDRAPLDPYPERQANWTARPPEPPLST